MLLFLCSRIEAFRNNILFSPLRKPRFSYKHSRATEIQSQKLANQLRILNNIVILSIKAKDERIKGSWHVEGGINTLKTYTSCVNIITTYRYRRRRIKNDRKKKWQEVLNGLMRGISRGKWSEKVQWYGYRAAASFTRWKPWYPRPLVGLWALSSSDLGDGDLRMQALFNLDMRSSFFTQFSNKRAFFITWCYDFLAQYWGKSNNAIYLQI